MENNITLIKQQMKDKKGAYVKLRARAGRRGVNVCSGIIDGLYPEVFTVMVDENGRFRRYCFCYSEILTHHVELSEETLPAVSSKL